jgi:hypothetical protein
MKRGILACAFLIVLTGIVVAGRRGTSDATPWSESGTQMDGSQASNTPLATPDQQNEANTKRTGPWQLDEAMKQLRLYPKDPLLQYIALQLARREGHNVAGEIDGIIGAEAQQLANERVSRVDLFSIFTGALAVQESLQLDTMRGGPRPARRFEPPTVRVEAKTDPQAQKMREEAEERRRKEFVPVASLSGPTIKSHPWEQMLAGKKPEVGPLSLCVPEDFYYVEFRSLNKLVDAVDQGHSWSNYFFNQASREARSHRVGERVKEQLAVETNRLLKPFYDLVVEEVAITGSDLFVNEGSDLTLLFKIKQPEVFRARMDGFLANARKSRTDAKETQGQYLGFDYVHVATPDRAVCVFSAYAKPDLHVRSNSFPALKRVLETISGKSSAAMPVRRLGETKEFAYIRTLMPRGAKEEDGFVYLSDPFIRRLVGPELKLTERRRMLCYNHLRMIGHASLLYRAEHGHAPHSLADLAQAQCTPGVFGEGALACPHGGTYTLSEDGMTGVCSHHGRSDSLTPCCEIPVTQITGEEADEYKAFLQEYNQYWRLYFDPIALRIQMSPQRYRLETIILPLIDNSIYTGLAHVLGGTPEPLDALPVPKRNIFSVAVRLNKTELLREAGIEDIRTAAGESKGAKSTGTVATAQRVQCSNNLRQIGLALHNYHDAYLKFPAAATFDKNGKPLLGWRVHILPFLEQEQLYREFHLDEPWDSEHNKKLIPRMPAVYRCPSQKLTEAGKTTYLAPIGEKTMFSGGATGTRFADVTDGTSNTIFIVDANDEHAVTWTKPDDLKYDSKKPLEGLLGKHPGFFTILMADGSVHHLRDGANENTMRAMFTRNGGETFELPEEMQNTGGPRGRSLLSVPFLSELPAFADFLSLGVGNQVGLHVYDSVQLFDLNLPSALGMAMGSFGGRRGPGFFGPNELPIAFLAASANSPVYIAVPVQDAKIVDEFLNQLDATLAALVRQPERQFFFGLDKDFYRFRAEKDQAIRTFAIGFGPIKWRFFWARIGKGLYVASKRFILEDLIALENAGPADTGAAAHGMIRVRPKNWDRVLPDFRLAWAENNRQACINNVGPLTSIARCLPDAVRNSELSRSIDRYLGAHLFCPEGGHYVLSPDGKNVTCNVHGDALAPHQAVAPANNSPPNQVLQNFTGMTVNLTFLEDGLHAVVTIDRK